jgi:hypothetical protein
VSSKNPIKRQQIGRKKKAKNPIERQQIGRKKKAKKPPPPTAPEIKDVHVDCFLDFLIEKSSRLAQLQAKNDNL